jgi:O-antigen/teichoic acid export membrane protein
VDELPKEKGHLPDRGKDSRILSDTKKAAKGAGFTLLGSAIGAALELVGQILLARFLGMGGLGLYSLGMAAVRIAEVVARLGIPLGGTRLVSIYKGTDQPRVKGVLLSSSGICLLSGCLTGLILWLLADSAAQRIFNNPEMAWVLRALAPAVPCVTLMAVSSSLLTGFHTTKFTVLSRNLIEPGVNLVFMAFFLLLGQGLKGVIWAFITSHVVAAICALRFMVKLFPSLTDSSVRPVYDLRRLMGNSVPILLIGVLNYVLAWTDTLMLGILSSTSAVGLYRASSRIPMILPLFLNATNSIYAPLAASLHAKGEKERLAGILKTTTRWVTYATVPGFLFIILGSTEIMSMFGREFTKEGNTVMVVLAVGCLVNSLTGGTGMTLMMCGRQHIQLYAAVGCVALNIFLNMLLIPNFGAIGAAIATSISMCAVNMAKLFFLWKLLNLHPFSIRTLGILAAGLGLLCLVWIMNGLIEAFGSWAFVARILVGVGGLIVFIIVWGLDKQDLILWQELKLKFLGKKQTAELGSFQG